VTAQLVASQGGLSSVELVTPFNVQPNSTVFLSSEMLFFKITEDRVLRVCSPSTTCLFILSAQLLT
jgi:hypothetical protein